MRKLIDICKRFCTYDRVYYDGKLLIAVMVALLFFTISCFILAFILWK